MFVNHIKKNITIALQMKAPLVNNDTSRTWNLNTFFFNTQKE